jgi:iron-sulfur cluster repair protein YtfE (RIC family)
MAGRAAVDLLGVVEHEHDHLVRMFTDIRSQFDSIASEDSPPQDFYREAIDDLDTALEEMLEHFDQEEQIVFPAIEGFRPDLAARISKLACVHEEICSKTRRLREVMCDMDELTSDPEEARSLVEFLCHTLTAHMTAEFELFVDALKDVDAAERQALLLKLASI